MKIWLISICALLFSITAFAQNIVLYTKYGKPVNAMVLPEMSAYEINESNEYHITTYSNATYLGTATRTYNCHSYAWNMSDGGPTCWINASIPETETNNLNIMKYWNNDYYKSTTEGNAVKIFYPNSDHSAIKSSVAGMYESKWGKGPLMRHAPGYGPYPNMDERSYFRHEIIGKPLICSNGSGYTHVGISSEYSMPSGYPSGNLVEYEWTVLDGKDENVIGTKANVNISSDGTSVMISFNRSGLYIITCECLIPGEMIAIYTFQAIVEN